MSHHETHDVADLDALTLSQEYVDLRPISRKYVRMSPNTMSKAFVSLSNGARCT
jgi:hypothetical protein